ncbi:MAG: TonB-dependent receptor [Sphingomonadales bacterium]|nr:TonB-dependent receptor [Sphingomonadales bacterium]
MHTARAALAAVLVAPILCHAAPAASQEAAAQDQPVYPAEFFAFGQPSNAFDMIALLPGFRLVEGNSSLRGYSGAGGNVLIDGQRPAGKAETLEDILKRIPAARVERIEILRAGAPGVDMQGYALLANVVLAKSGRLGGRAEWRQGFYRDVGLAPRVAGQVDFDKGGHIVNLSAALYRDIDDEHGYGTRNRYALDGTPLRLARYFQPEETRGIDATAEYRKAMLGGTLRLDGLIRAKRQIVDLGYDISFPVPATIRGSERKRTRIYEGGLRFERPLGSTTDFDFISSYRYERGAGEDRESSATESDISNKNSVRREAIMRAAFRHKRGAATFELGAEGAINSLDSLNRLFENDVEIALPNAQVRVEEHRAEFFANSNWKLGGAFALDAGLRYEVSRLTQSGDTSLSKSLSFLKPRARLSWSPAGSHELRVLVEREVGQLDFGNFVGAASLNAGTISAGNRDLEPDSLWRAEVAYEHRFGAGSIVLAARREWISDLIDQLPLTIGGVVYDGIGNIGSARRDEFEASVKLPLDRLGLKGVLVTGDATARRSRATDPSTGERRRISKDLPLEAKVTLSHDIPAWKLRWGGSFTFAEEQRSFKIREIQTDRLGGRLELFVEYKPDSHWTLRLYGRNLTDSPGVRTREIYTGIRGGSAYRYTDVRTLRAGPYVGFEIQRRFGG